MSALAWTDSSMECHSPMLDHERRFLPPQAAVEAFLNATGPYTEPRLYASDYPYAFTRTTYFDTQELALLSSRGTGRAQRLRLREYAGAAELGQPAVLTGLRYFELKVTSGERRMKSRCPVSGAEAEALLTGAPLSDESTAGALLKQFLATPVKPWVTAWYRRTTHETSDGRVRITLDEDLLFALPPAPGSSALPSQVLQRSPAALLEVKWQGRPPFWLEHALRLLGPSESQGSKFEQGMRALFGGLLPVPLSRAR
ncbi:VTC domain-containing protein [Hyalangium versicolor]|uniref:VTC domain-containing protein n=1 Tax=Hyalangium versicolor TaxID=2861190 RepID=UPI001CCB12FC|nr:VTC domain-containing protein [Hyalangium versicolor]